MTQLMIVDRDGEEHEVAARPGVRLMEVLRDLDYGVAAVCGGLCSCATCHVYINGDWADRLPEPQSDELELLAELPTYRKPTSRLSCQITLTEAFNGLRITIAPDL